MLVQALRLLNRMPRDLLPDQLPDDQENARTEHQEKKRLMELQYSDTIMIQLFGYIWLVIIDRKSVV